MSDCCCDPAPRRPTRSALGTIASTIAMIVLPKCPLCVAAYLSAIGVGVGAGTAAVVLRAAQVASAAMLLAAIAGLALWLRQRRA